MNRPLLIALGITLFSGAAFAAEMTDDEKTLYALGQLVAQKTAVFRLSAEELDLVQRGWRDATGGNDSAVDVDEYKAKVNELARAREALAVQESVAKGAEVLAQAAAEPGAVTADSGFVYLSVADGLGEQPKPSDRVKVHYRGTLPDGTEFDSSYKRNEPTEFPLSGVIKCWTEGVAMMKVGGKAKLTCPANTAYGDRGAGGLIPPGATLVFEVELLEITSN